MALALVLWNVMGTMADVWETLLTTALGPEAAAEIHDDEFRRLESNRAFQ